MRRHLPLLLVLLGALVVGVVGDRAAWPDPTTQAPRTAFTSGQYLATATARATWEEGHFLAPQVDLVGWPVPAGFRPVVWPSAFAAVWMPPLVAVNLSFLLMPLFNALGGYALGRAWLPGEPPAVEAGAVATAGLLAWHPWVRETLANGQIEQACIGGVALVWASAPWAARGGPARWAALLLLQALVAVSAPHLALGGAIGLGVFAAVDAARRREGRVGWAGVLVAAAFGTLIAGAYHTSGFSAPNQVLWPKGSPGHPAGLAGLSEVTRLGSLFLPPAPFLGDGTFHPNYLGGVLSLAALLGGWRRPAALLAGALLLTFSLGPTLADGLPGPYALLGLLSDTVAQSQSPYRFVAAATVCLALAAGAAVRSPPAALLLVALAWTETQLTGTRPFPAPTQSFPLDAEVAAFRAGTGPILDLPLAGGRCPVGNVHYAIEATRRLRPTPVSVATTAVYGTLPGLQPALAAALRPRPCDASLPALLTRTGFTTVVLHTHDPTCPVPPGLERCLDESLGSGAHADGLRWWDLPAREAP